MLILLSMDANEEVEAGSPAAERGFVWEDLSRAPGASVGSDGASRVRAIEGEKGSDKIWESRGTARKRVKDPIAKSCPCLDAAILQKSTSRWIRHKTAADA